MKSDLRNYLYLITLDIRNLNQKTRLLLRRIKVVDVYDQFIN